MRMTFIFLLAIFLQAKSFSQKVSFSGKAVSLQQVFTSIERQTGYIFYYKMEILQDAKKVDISFNNIPLDSALKQLFKNQPLKYTIVEKNIVVSHYLPPPERTTIPVNGMVLAEDGQPLPGASIVNKEESTSVMADAKGKFSINSFSGHTLLVTFVGYDPKEILITGEIAHNPGILVRLKVSANNLEEVAIVSTGYQKISKERATGSFVQIDNALLNRSVSTDILSRLDGVTSGLSFSKNMVSGKNPSEISIRGRSTIFANPKPLIIIDNFPYDGDITNINPNDVESVTILKDAAAASIWGAFSGNGVIVITTKKGRYNQAPKVTFNSNLTIAGKPDLFYQPRMPVSDYADLEQFLYSKGFYNTTINGNLYGLSPVVDILNKASLGQLTDEEAKAQIDALRNKDVRSEKEKYLYRNSVNQQYALNISGGSNHHQYAFSAGYDRNLNSGVNDQFQRITLNANNSWRLLEDKLQVNAGIFFTKTIDKRNTGGLGSPGYDLHPYFSFKDADGKAAIANYNRQFFRPAYIDTTGKGKLLDWYYRPLDEIDLADNRINTVNYRINVGLTYKILPDLSAAINYQYNTITSEQKQFFSEQTYFTRDLINRYSQVNYQTGNVIRPVPLGGVLDTRNNTYDAHNIRGQLNYSHTWQNMHALNALVAAEIKDAGTFIEIDRQYGYDKDLAILKPVNYQATFPMQYNYFDQRLIPFLTRHLGNTDRFISYLGNFSYTYNNRYTLYASARKDASNLFGVNTNQRGVPLWSVGMSWDISREAFYRVSWLPYLKLRISRGYNGNVDRSISAYITSTMNGTNVYGNITGNITNPPNPSLRWEKIQVMNVGIDFASKDQRIEGSLEYYTKKGIDLLGFSPIAPSTGVAEFKGNTADMKGRGIDIVLNTKNLTGPLTWNTTLLFNYNTDKVTSYKVKQLAVGYYLNDAFFNPLEGRPLYSVYSFRWAGLDPQTGDPQGYVDGKVTKDYTAIFNSTDFNDLVYSGPMNPPFFGSLRNTFAWKALSFSFNITYKYGHYFRRTSLNYDNLFLNGFAYSHPDYNQRWQQPGDEINTNVPSFQYPVEGGRDQFYGASSVLIERGDHIRLQDLQLSYQFSSLRVGNHAIRGIRLYVYANNIGILWKANNKGIDPDFALPDATPAPRSIAAGATIDL